MKYEPLVFIHLLLSLAHLIFDNLWTKIPAVELAEYCIKGAPIVGVTPSVFKIGESCCFEDQLYRRVY